MLNIDLHCHSTVSDGLLTPTQLVEHAAVRGVSVLVHWLPQPLLASQNCCVNDIPSVSN